MKTKLLFSILGLFTILGLNSCENQPQVNTLKIGDPIPQIELFNQNNQLVSVNDFVGQQNMVIYFYPKDDTPGCTKEACGFRDSFEHFQDLNVMVFGISSDSPESHLAFADKYNLPFMLLSDSENKISQAFGVPSEYMGALPGRVTFLVDKTGTIQYVLKDLDSAEEHVKEAMRILPKI